MKITDVVTYAFKGPHSITAPPMLHDPLPFLAKIRNMAKGSKWPCLSR